jgi:leucyl aminopeptidase
VFIEGNILSESINDVQTAAAYVAEGIKLRNYKFVKHYFNKKKDHELTLKSVNIFSNHSEEASKVFDRYSATVDGVILTRDLITEPGNVIYPESFAEKCLEMQKFGLKVKVLTSKEMAALGMGALLGVAQGSVNDARLVVLEWWGDARGNSIPPLALVGKGVTFDTGGINLKSSSHIAEMKYGMGGAGVVAGVMQSLAQQKVQKNVVGLLGLVENMPSGSAQRPSDVVISMSGQTIEVDNTDAEGRLVLADVIWYSQTEYNCQTIIDLATLTGAISIALGDEYAGLFSNNEELQEQLIKSGKEVNELLWRMPLSEHYDSRINSEIADMRNTGRISGAGATTAAQFLQRFLKDTNRKWAHLDIAGVTWTTNGELTNGLKGATGFGVRLLENFIHTYYKP